MPYVETHFPATVTAPQTIRAFLRAALHTWELDGFGELTELLSCELVSNVVRHLGSPGTLRATSDGKVLRIEVDDASTEVPTVQHPAPADPAGRGLLIVDSLSTAWGVDMRDDGKTVWFELDVGTANGAEDRANDA
jgi:anti-sigma regulatory factor (Ser/Thr protein kinase)